MNNKTAAEYEQELLKVLESEPGLISKSAVFIGALLAAHDNGSKEGLEGFLNAGNKVFGHLKTKS